MKGLDPSSAHSPSRPSTNFRLMKNYCKSLCIKERQLRSKQRKPRKPQPFLWFKFDPDDHRQLILSNGTRLRQACRSIPLAGRQRLCPLASGAAQSSRQLLEEKHLLQTSPHRSRSQSGTVLPLCSLAWTHLSSPPTDGICLARRHPRWHGAGSYQW